jgi:hypothetical protein
MEAAELEAAASSTVVATVFDVLAFITGGPSHEFVLLAEKYWAAISSQAGCVTTVAGGTDRANTSFAVQEAY